MTRRCAILVSTLVLLFGNLLAAEELRTCGHCGCCLRKVVRMDCTTEEVVEHVYDCKCEDFALPGPSKKCHVPCACGDDCCDADCGHHDHVVWQPGHCGKPRTRKMLVKYEYVKKVPAYKCVVEYVCDQCQCGASHLGPTEHLPPPPPGPEKNEPKDAKEARLPIRPASLEQAPGTTGFSWRSIFGG